MSDTPEQMILSDRKFDVTERGIAVGNRCCSLQDPKTRGLADCSHRMCNNFGGRWQHSKYSWTDSLMCKAGVISNKQTGDATSPTQRVGERGARHDHYAHRILVVLRTRRI